MELKKGKGFTLMEMLIVVAIIAILIAIAIPVYHNYIEKTQETVCLGNRRSMLSEMTYTAILEDLDQAKANQIISKYQRACPAGGTISAALSEAGITLSCSVHGQESGRANVSLTYVQDFAAFIQDPNNGLASSAKYSNDRLREAFYAKYDNTWPTLIIDGARYQIEPYFSSKGSGKEDLSDYVWLFARKEGSTNGVANNWNVPLVYNPKTGQWYECLNYNGTAQGSTSINSFADVTALETALLNDKLNNGNLKWRPVTDWEEIWPESQ